MNLSRRRILVVLGVFVSAVFLWLAFRGTDLREVWGSLRTANLRFAIPLLITLGATYWLKALRWSLLLRPLVRTRPKDLFPAVMIGYASNIVLPAQLGELVRVYVIGRQLKLEATPVLATIVLERMFDFLTVLLLLAFALLLSPQPTTELLTASYVVGGAGLLIIVVSAVFLRWTDRCVAIVDRVLAFVPLRIRKKMMNQIEMGVGGLKSIRDWRTMLAVAAASILQWFLMGVCIYMSLLAVDLHVSLIAAFVVVAFTVAGLTLPSSPGYFGTIQLSFVLALVPFGAGKTSALAASMVWHSLAYLSVTALGIFFFLRFGYALDDMRHRMQGDSGRRRNTPNATSL